MPSEPRSCWWLCSCRHCWPHTTLRVKQGERGVPSPALPSGRAQSNEGQSLERWGTELRTVRTELRTVRDTGQSSELQGTELRTMRDRSDPCGTASALHNRSVFKLQTHWAECRRALKLYKNRERERKRQKAKEWFSRMKGKNRI